MSNTSSTSFEFRISSMRFFHRSFSDSTPLLSFTFLSSFPLSPIHSSPPFTLSFLSAPPPLLPLLRSSRCSLSLSRSSLSRVGHGQRSASQPGAEVWQRRESGCASGTGARGGDCGKILMPATVCPPPVVLNHRYGESCSTSCFHAPRAFHRARKKRGSREGKKGVSLGASRENSTIARRGSESKGGETSRGESRNAHTC